MRFIPRTWPLWMLVVYLILDSSLAAIWLAAQLRLGFDAVGVIAVTILLLLVRWDWRKLHERRAERRVQ